MRIESITLRNFRCFHEFTLNLQTNLSLLVGRNNTGKTSILAALERFVSRTCSFSFSDLNTSFAHELAEAILNHASWREESTSIDLELSISYDEDDNIAPLAPALLDLDPNNSSITLKFSYSLTETAYDRLSSEYSEWLKSTDKSSSPSSFYDYFGKRMGSYLKMRCTSVPSKGRNSRLRSLKNEDIRGIVSFQGITAPRDVANAEASGSLSKLATNYYRILKDDSDLPPEAVALENALATADNALSESYEKVFKDLVSTVRTFGGAKPNETEISFVSRLGASNLLPAEISLAYRGEQDSPQLPESHNGLGYMNLIGVLMQISSAIKSFKGGKDSTSAAVNILFVEEPEAHTHPQLQRIFMSNIKELIDTERGVLDESGEQINVQSIITTHSPHIVATSDLEDIVYMRRAEGDVLAQPLACMGASSRTDDIRFLRQYLTLARADILFADKLIFIEGDTERILLPAMMKKVDEETSQGSEGIPLLSQHISIVEVGNNSRAFEPLIRFLRLKTLILTDCDYSRGRSGSPKEEADGTTNFSLKHYLAEIDGWNSNRVEYLANHHCVTLQDADNGATTTWHEDPNGYLRIGFQGSETLNGTSFHPRTFEDCFIFKNCDFVKKHMEEMLSVSDFEEPKGEIEFARTAANHINSKAGFAIDILIAGSDDTSGPLSQVELPSYIEEGLKWLRKQ